MRLLFLLPLISLVACRSEAPYMVDTCRYQEVLQQCLAIAPKGPNSIHNSNDMDEVVEACGAQAKYVATTTRDKIKPECQGRGVW